MKYTVRMTIIDHVEADSESEAESIMEARLYAGNRFNDPFIMELTVRPFKSLAPEPRKPTPMTPLSLLPLSTRSYNCLTQYLRGIGKIDNEEHRVEDCLHLTEQDLLGIRNIGKRSAQEITKVFRELDYEDWPRKPLASGQLSKTKKEVTDHGLLH
jgi:DNA-directed RNA polymerase alpha subunit